MNELILIDGNSLLFKAFYATGYMGNYMINKDGIPLNGVFGFARMMDKILEQNAKYVIVAFDYGKYDLDNNAMTTLNQISPNAIVDIKGEASYPGSTKVNQALSEKRAEAVAQYLKDRGVRINSAEGLGETGHQIVTVIVK